MKRGKYSKRGIATKTMVLLLALMLVVGTAVGGTVAYLFTAPQTVTNTFTVGDINISLVEHAYNPDSPADITTTVDNENSYPLIPGTVYAKDPTVTVEANSEDCYLFVKLVETNNPATYLTYTVNEDGWTSLAGVPGVYYRVVEKDDEDRSWTLLTDDKVTVKTNIVKDGTAGENLVVMPSNNPVLTFTAYAVQKDNLTVGEAWNLVKNLG